MRRIEPIAARIPYMTCVGNHEIEQGTFAHYRYLLLFSPGSQINANILDIVLPCRIPTSPVIL